MLNSKSRRYYVIVNRFDTITSSSDHSERNAWHRFLINTRATPTFPDINTFIAYHKTLGWKCKLVEIREVE